MTLQIAQSNVEIIVNDTPPIIRSDGAELASTIGARSLEAIPLPTRNFLQLLMLAPGVTAPLTNNSAIGRNSPNVSVNGSRVTQNSYQINGVDANDISLHNLADVAVPGPESVSEVKIQTSLYDATVAGAGASVQIVTKIGTNFLHGSAYEYFRNEAFNANDANLKAVGEGRPEMRRNVYGATLGGPLRKNKAFFFVSYQGTREANGATDQSLYKYSGKEPVLRDLSLEIQPAEILGLAGASGSGKSTLALAVMNLLRSDCSISGHVRFNNHELLAMTPSELRKIHGRELALILQSPAAALNPMLRIGTQLWEAWKAHERTHEGDMAILEALEAIYHAVIRGRSVMRT